VDSLEDYRFVKVNCCFKIIRPEEKESCLCCGCCKSWLHIACVPLESKATFLCGLCTLPFPGITWGEGLQYSCQYDSVMQFILIRTVDDDCLFDAIMSVDYANGMIATAMSECIGLSYDEDWAGMHKNWALVTGNNSTSMYGSTSAVFWNHVKAGGLFKQTDFCTMCSFSKEVKVMQIPFLDPYISARENIERLFNPNESFVCGPCTMCPDGVRMSSGYSPLSHKTWFCVIEIDRMPHQARECFQVPKEILFDDGKFTLAGFVIHSKARSKD
jgi:hypothetical protein